MENFAFIGFAILIVFILVVWVFFVRRNVKKTVRKCSDLEKEIFELQSREYSCLVDLLRLVGREKENSLGKEGFDRCSVAVRQKQLDVFSSMVFRIVEESPKRISNKVQKLQIEEMDLIAKSRILEQKYNANARYVNSKISTLPTSIVLRDVCSIDVFSSPCVRRVNSNNFGN